MRARGRFCLGVLVGLAAGSVLRRLTAGGFSQDQIRRIYKLWAPVYGLADVYTFGQLPHLREVSIDRLRLEPGSSVLDLSCGTGANFARLQAEIGPEGRLVGLDRSKAMLVEAERLVKSKRWPNVELVEADAANFDLGERFDAVLWVLAASVVVGWQLALERAAVHLRPGGRLVIADGRLSGRWYALPFNWIADLSGAGAAADLGRRPWRLVTRYLDNAGYEEFFMGFLYVVWGERPSEVPGPAHSADRYHLPLKQ